MISLYLGITLFVIGSLILILLVLYLTYTISVYLCIGLAGSILMVIGAVLVSKEL